MPSFKSRNTWVALDMAGCPNRCRHCGLGWHPNERMSEEDLRWVVNLFRNWARPGDEEPFFERVDAVTWFREPEFHPDYRRLYELATELNGHPPTRFELLSIWRLARDEDYARWAKEVGTEGCQLTFFGTQKTNDWFFRRKGAFHDNLVATERLLEIGICPRWQVFLTRRILPELDALLKLVDRMRLHARTEAIGGKFDIFLNTPSPDGEAWNIEHIRPTVEDLARVPSELVERSERYLGHSIGEAEGALVLRMLRRNLLSRLLILTRKSWDSSSLRSLTCLRTWAN